MSDPQIVKELEDISALFVQTAEGAEIGSGRLTLKGVAKSTLYFSDRPQRVVGHVATPDFVGIWDEGDNSFAVDPPNAVLAFVADGDTTPEDVVIEINDPIVSGSDLSYSAVVLDGALPEKIRACTL